MIFAVGVSAGAFTVNGLSSLQREELDIYFKGFLQLLDYQSIDSSELFKISLVENLKIVGILWILGVMIIGIPFIYIVIGLRGFITGFGSGFIIKVLGLKGVVFTMLTIIPKEIVIIPCVIALGVNGINFSLSIIKSKSIKHLSKESIKSNFMTYCFTTLFYIFIIFLGILIEVFITPVFMRIITPLITN